MLNTSSAQKLSPKPLTQRPHQQGVRPQACHSLPAIQQTVTVNFHYGVHFTRGLFMPGNSSLVDVIAPLDAVAPPSPTRAIVVIDGGLVAAKPELCEQVLAYSECYRKRLHWVEPPLVMPAGEAVKNKPELVQSIQQTIEKAGLCRHSYVLAIGGGALLDMVGYAAATAHRGLRLIRIPTTVLSQNDSGVGVKNSINAFGKKNFLGTFSPPYAVLNDSDFLMSLGDRDWRAGIAEALKVALIKDAEFFDFMADYAGALVRRDRDAMELIIHRCAELHLQHIATSGDPFELGSSRPLDFGHWAAHKLEQLTNYRLRHGEAVAMGLALDCTYSYLDGKLEEADWRRILDTLQTLGFEICCAELVEHAGHPEHPDSVFQGLREFQEHLGGQLTLMLLQRIGQGFEVHEVDIARYQAAIALLQAQSSPA